MSEPIIDHSDEIGRVQALIGLLNDFDPTGKWKHYQILVKWQTSSYSLTRGEWFDLINCLEDAWKRAQPKGNEPAYIQQNLLE